MEEWITEWAVEVTWADWRAAGAKGPTSQYGPFEHESQRDLFLATQRRDRAVAATRVLTRRAAYTAWTPTSAVEETSEAERQRLLAEVYEQITGAVHPHPPERDERS
ncbi:hypothetical protein [Nocardioides oceani]|uniref:hypothetical protein n=1 Tax=Nocardioides oceani TaxID=3058369 RepID=UPI00262B2438|nr:hypothetical protein [Nocardioides oceani]